MENNEQPSFVNNESTECTQETKKQLTVISYLHDLVFGLVGILLVFMLLFRVVVVSGPSMMPTLQNGDCLILLSNVFYNDPKYGDIVVASKDSYKNSEPIIKRVIATEGQEVDIDFVKGIVYVDGVALSEPYTNTPTNLFEGVSFPLVVDKGCVFVMGDNRNDSKDSRNPQIGQIDRREILGKALILALPGKSADTGKRELNRIGALR
ncbi:MAG: signal peptidase I [Oscillospiraceae bacterium]|nr:signal peptidase I [Oscillospiraceae bacterium]